MKKTVALLLVIALLAAMLAGCSSPAAYKASKRAFNNTTEAYLLVNQYSKDIYEAWRLGINEKSTYSRESGLQSLSYELYVDAQSLEMAVASLLGKETFSSGDWGRLQDRYSSFFSACVSVVSEAYVVNGTADEIEALLVDAKSEMKTLGDKYSDYTHYPALKAYFTNTLAFFDFCKNPEGSFEQVVETFNTYRNNARTYFFELNYVFEDSIGGMYDTKTEDEVIAEDAI